jgi:hypothetical protein
MQELSLSRRGRDIGEITERVRKPRAGSPQRIVGSTDSHREALDEAGNMQNGHAPGRTFVFVSALEPLAAAQAVWSSPVPIDLAVAGPSEAARQTARFAVAGRPVRMVSEPLLAARRPSESDIAMAARKADALLALYALDTHVALVVWDELEHQPEPLIVDEWWLLDRAERISLALPLP